MINSVDELIEVYHLNKRIPDSNTLFKSCIKNVYSIYIGMENYIKGVNLTKSALTLRDLYSVENNDKIYDGLRDTAFFYRVADLLKEFNIQGLNPISEEKAKEEEICNTSKSIHDYVTKNIGNLESKKSGTQKEIDSELIQKNNDSIQGAVVKPLERVSKNNDCEKRFVLVNDWGEVIYGPCTMLESRPIREYRPYGYTWEKYSKDKEYKFRLKTVKEFERMYYGSKKSSFDWITFITIATTIATIVGMIKCYLI